MAQTEKQAKARVRNWQKARLIGFVLDTSALSVVEYEKYIKMLRLKNEMLKTWDTHTAYLAGKTIAPYKCWCGKRTTVERLSNREAQFGGPQYLCKEHWKDEQLEGHLPEQEKPDSV